MARSCTYSPGKGTKMFFALKRELGYDMAWNVWALAASDEFREIYGKDAEFDEEGMPTYESVRSNPWIRGYINGTVQRDNLDAGYSERDDTIEGYNLAVNEAVAFNKSDVAGDKFVAVVERNGGKVRTRIVDRTDDTVNMAFNQTASHKLNRNLADILAPVGVTYDILSDEEMDAGRVGVTDFSVAKNIATDSVAMIRIANNMEGADALGEEFCHVLVRALENNPLLARVRALLENNDDLLRYVLGETYDDTMEFHNNDRDLVVEEALGQLLHDGLLGATKEELATGTLMGRLVRNVRDRFRNLSASDITKAINEAEGIMSDLAREILDASSETAKSIRATKRHDLAMEAQFNALSDRIERNIEFLKHARDIELKRYKIGSKSMPRSASPEAKREYIERTKRGIEIIEEYITKPNDLDTTRGVLEYAHQALSELRFASRGLAALDTMDPEMKYRELLNVRRCIRCYGETIDRLNGLYHDENREAENDFDRAITIDTITGTQELKLDEVLRDLNDISRKVVTEFTRSAMPAFARFLEPYLGKDMMDALSKKAGRKVTVDEFLESADQDISFFDYFLDAMADSSSVLLQSFDRVVKKAKYEGRTKALSLMKTVRQLMFEASRRSITSYEWAFEKYDDGHKTGNYISKVNVGQYQRDARNFEKELNEKYGEHPKKREDYIARSREKRQWISSHCDVSALTSLAEFMGTPLEELPPSSIAYANSDFDNLSSDQKFILEEYLKLKTKMDKLYPSDKVEPNKAIQSRKNGVQRVIDVAKSPETIYSSIMEHLKSEFIRQEDDDAVFGAARTGLTDFDGREFLTLPALFTTRLKNPDDLSTDIFGALMAYAAAAYEYSELSNVIDPLELGRGLVLDNLEVQKTSGSNGIVEKIETLGRNVENKVLKNQGTSRLASRLNAYFESNIYHRYLEDSGAIGKVDINKATSFLIGTSAVAQLGFNFLANFANVATGLAMQNIEAAAGEFFTFKELARADAIYAQQFGSTISEINSRNPTSKLALVGELFNVRHGYEKLLRESQRNSALARFFGKSICFLGQEAGDHWLYNRSMIAMLLHTKVNVPGTGETNLWDAIQTRKTGNYDFGEGAEQVYEAYIPNGTTLIDDDGNITDKKADVFELTERIDHVNRQLFGLYDDENRNVARRMALGRLIMLYRNWIKPQMNKRFQAEQYDMATGKFQEGFHRTAGKFLWGLAQELSRGQFQIAAAWRNLSDAEKKNIQRSLFEIGQVLLTWAGAQLTWGWSNKKDRVWRRQFLAYSMRRLYHETAVFVPSLALLDEGIRTLKSPTPVISTVQSMSNLIYSMVTPDDWTEEIKSGKFKGWTRLQRNLYRAPLPVIVQYRQIDRFTGDLDPLTQALARSAYTGY